MSIVSITAKTISGTLNKAGPNAGEIFVGRNQKSAVVMEGYIGGPREKDAQGNYRATVYGRLPVQAAITGEGDKQRYVLEIAGGLRGVLFRNEKKGENSPDYTGNIDLDNGKVLPLFGRKVHSENGDFISLSSGEAEDKKNGNGGKGASAPAPATDFQDDGDIPF